MERECVTNHLDHKLRLILITQILIMTYYVCLSVCVSVVALVTPSAVQKLLNGSRCVWWADSREPKKQRISLAPPGEYD